MSENCDLLGCYAASSGNFLPTFRDNLSVSSSGVKNGNDILSQKPVRNNHYSPRNNP